MQRTMLNVLPTTTAALRHELALPSTGAALHTLAAIELADGSPHSEVLRQTGGEE